MASEPPLQWQRTHAQEQVDSGVSAGTESMDTGRAGSCQLRLSLVQNMSMWGLELTESQSR